MTEKQIKDRTKRFLKKLPLRDNKARKLLLKFPKWDDENAQNMAVETIIILYETYQGKQYKMGILEAYQEAIKIYGERWLSWRKDVNEQIKHEQGGDENGSEEVTQDGDR